MSVMTTRKRLALVIRSRMALCEMTQARLAEQINMGRSSLSARLSGERDFSYSELESVAQALSVSLRDLLPAEEKEEQR
ncbi:helix-turn-helix domain-containing protein [Kocuria palustris]|uniref:helix-turn-helix domain-containing protein n=2 Tax=Kocuria palustris TaxID=71999 RepID=UPI0021A452DB|nr:helix-turn-helix transcriptional regulator [Kocuria palustris]MCT1591401.1 helix-turn-helix transcriptional regulator [Kocuria palustris]